MTMQDANLPPAAGGINPRGRGRPGHVFMLANPAWPDVHRIGKTVRSVASRLAAANLRTPHPNRVVLAVKVIDCDAAERAIQQRFGHLRTTPDRDFYRVSPEEVLRALQPFVFVRGSDIKRRAVAMTVYLMPDDHARLRSLAAAIGRSAQQIVMDGLDKVFAETGQVPTERWRTRVAGTLGRRPGRLDGRRDLAPA